MFRLISMQWLCLLVLSFATAAVPRAAVGGLYRFDKILDTTEFYSIGARAVPSISENGNVTYRLEGLTTVDLSYTDLSEFGIPLDDTGPYQGFQEPNFNDHGDAVFTGRFHGGGKTILFWSDTQLSTVVDQTGVYHSLGNRNSINNRGDVLFGATLDAVPDAARLYIWNDGIIQSVVGAGDMIDGMSISATVGVGRNALNDSGQIAFNVVFTDGSRALYRGTPIAVPEPATSVTLLIGTALLTLSIRRRRSRSAMNLR